MADGTYRFQQPGAGQFYFQTQQHNHHPAHQRHLIRNGTSSPTGRLKFNNTDTPSPSRSPPLNQSPSHNSYTMYSQGHQGQPVMMNGQSHQRFGMPMPKFQHPTHHPHHAQQPHHPHSQSTQNLAHQHNFSGGALSNAAQHFTPAHLQNGTTSNVEDEIEEPMNEHWQQQLQLAAESRQASSPHYYARAVAQQTKGLQLSSNQADPNENGTEERNRATAVKDHRRQDWVALDFGGQGLRALSNGLFHYSFLDKLYLNHNKLKSLPSSIGELKNLTHLDISSNELTEIPEEIGMLTNLKKLLLFDNSLQTLPFELGYLYQLDTLGIEGNPLADVLKSRIMQEGTKSLIKYLKEEMPDSLSPEDGKESQGTSTPVEPAPSVEYSSASQIPILVCGDFNSCPGSAVYNLLAHGRMAEEHPDLEQRLYGNLSRMGMSHPFTLKSAYSTIGELSFTNYTPGFTDVIDYIWYSSNTLQVTALLGEVDKEYLKRVPGFPNYHFPSDHLALMAEFSVKSKKNKPVEADFGPQREKTICRRADDPASYFGIFTYGVLLGIWMEGGVIIDSAANPRLLDQSAMGRLVTADLWGSRRQAMDIGRGSRPVSYSEQELELHRKEEENMDSVGQMLKVLRDEGMLSADGMFHLRDYDVAVENVKKFRRAFIGLTKDDEERHRVSRLWPYQADG
ncbi:CCR4 [Coccidioides immitis H538.4]|uniref:CCR4-Not complex 3'-5'-exoribonuclease subunit Ccr4 n=1 Tax=Coccidioides immitis H538.4 TaxID=396776 RepID=A0A0J8RXG3_COCIT|nr:CCR4 [Coccidioides immitis H538.4]